MHQYDSRRPETFYWGFDEDMLEVFIDDPDNLDYQLNDGIMDEDTYEFFKENLNKIKTRTNIRLIMKYGGT